MTLEEHNALQRAYNIELSLWMDETIAVAAVSPFALLDAQRAASREASHE